MFKSQFDFVYNTYYSHWVETPCYSAVDCMFDLKEDILIVLNLWNEN